MSYFKDGFGGSNADDYNHLKIQWITGRPQSKAKFKLVDHRYTIRGVAIHIWRAGVRQYGIKVGSKRDSALTFTVAKRRAARMVANGS